MNSSQEHTADQPAQEWDNRTLARNMGLKANVSIAKSAFRELRNQWYKYISEPLKCRLYSQILK